MPDSKDLIIISASCGKNLELSKKFQEKSNEIKFKSENLENIWLEGGCLSEGYF